LNRIIVSGIKALVLGLGLIASLRAAQPVPAGVTADSSGALPQLPPDFQKAAGRQQVSPSSVPANGGAPGRSENQAPLPELVPLPDTQDSQPRGRATVPGPTVPLEWPIQPRMEPAPTGAPGAARPRKIRLYSLSARDEDVHHFLDRVASESGTTILVSPRVTARITRDFNGMTLEDLISSTLKLAGLVEKVQAGVHFVYSNEQADDVAEMTKKIWIANLSDQVVTKGQIELEDGGRTVDEGSKFRIYNIAGIDWADRVVVKIAIGNIQGNVSIDQVISLPQAIEYFTSLLRTSSDQSSVYAARANIWYELGEDDIAIRDYDQAIKLAPTNAIMFNNRGYVSWRQKAYDKALADYSESIRLEPKSATAFNNRSLLWATWPDAKYRDVLRAVKTAHVWESGGQADLDVINTLALASVLSKDRTKIADWVAAFPQNDATARFAQLVTLYDAVIKMQCYIAMHGLAN
jgi:hypothetical protein